MLAEWSHNYECVHNDLNVIVLRLQREADELMQAEIRCKDAELQIAHLEQLLTWAKALDTRAENFVRRLIATSIPARQLSEQQKALRELQSKQTQFRLSADANLSLAETLELECAALRRKLALMEQEESAKNASLQAL